MKIGLEIHVPLNTRSKLFCTCPTNFLSAEPNTNVCPVCTGQPGSKPMGLNEKALELGLKIALALNCEISPSFRFLRKHYFYPDLPNNYQRTSEPLGRNGKLGKVRIWEVHIEEDPGRYDLRKGTVDYNRSGIPLVEIVTAPDIGSVEELRDFLRTLYSVLSYLDAIHPEGTLRMDVNISLYDTRVEIKNVNSIHGAVKAVQYEILRQENLRRQGQEIKRETRHYDENHGITIALRTKETAEDYRYVPDPDVPPVDVGRDLVEKVRGEMPELPHERMRRFMEEYGLNRTVAWTLVLDRELGDFFEEMAREMGVEFCVEWCAKILRGELNYRNMRMKDVDRDEVVEVLRAVREEKIGKPAGVEVLRKVLDGEGRARDLLRTYTAPPLEEVVEEVIRENPEAVRDYRSGKKKALDYLVGQVLRKTKGVYDPKKVRERLEVVLRG